MNYRRYEKGGTVQVGAKRGMWGPSAPSTKNKPRWMEGTPSGGKPGERPHSAPQAVVASADQKSGHHAGGGVKAGSNNSAGSAASHTSGDTSSKIENRLGIVKKNRRSNYTGTLSGLSCIDLTKDDSTDTRKKINDYIKISREVPTVCLGSFSSNEPQDFFEVHFSVTPHRSGITKQTLSSAVPNVVKDCSVST